jgi:hypothetical protein
MNRLWTAGFVVMIAVAVPSCTKKSNDPSPTGPPKFQAILLQGNEFPVIDNADRTGSGIANITLNVTRDASNNITAATADFAVSLQNFPLGTSLTGAHIHPGKAGASGNVIVNTGLASGEIVLPSGSGTITKTANVDVTVAQNIINDPSSFYFNVHTTLSTGGAIRGQLVAQ